jgi:hypothetical protein
LLVHAKRGGTAENRSGGVECPLILRMLDLVSVWAMRWISALVAGVPGTTSRA